VTAKGEAPKKWKAKDANWRRRSVLRENYLKEKSSERASSTPVAGQFAAE
jgi:hypothetical protein